MQEDVFVKLENLEKSFGTRRVLSGLTLSIPRGKISFIIGRSGEGKSVTIKHIVGLLKPDKGRIWIEGRAMHTASQAVWEDVRKRIGILFQDGALFDSLNVLENVSFPMENHYSLSEEERLQRVSSLLDSVGLEDVMDKYPGTLSIGERKRVGLARALALSPQLLLYDEPTTSMDPFVADLIDSLIVDTQQKNKGLTTVVISHDIRSIMTVAEYIFLLHQGKVYFEGTPAQFQDSQDALVVQFLNGALQGPLEKPLE